MGTIRLGTNGWRARVGSGFDADNVARIAAALGHAWAPRYEGSTVLVGYDTRHNAERFALLVGEVLAGCGMRVVVSAGVCTTPALEWSVAHDPLCVGGVMLTASEASCEFGGIIIRQGDGGPMTPEFADGVERGILRRLPVERGEVQRADLVSAYADHLVQESDSSLIESRGLRVVVDSMYGAATSCAREVFERVGCEVVALHDRPVPDFRGLHPDAREPWVDECERMVVKTGAQLGVVLDGDSDRFALIDAQGRLVSQHDLAPLVLEHLVLQRGRRGRVVATSASSARIARQAERLDCDFTMVPVGFTALYREFAEGDVVLAADELGGVCVPHHLPERDGLLGALMIVEMMAGTDESLRTMVDNLEREIGQLEYASKDVRLDFAAIQRLHNLLPGVNPSEVCGLVPQRVSHADGLRLEMEDGTWMLLRTSREKPVARIYVEAPTQKTRSDLLKWAQEALHAL